MWAFVEKVVGVRSARSDRRIAIGFGLAAAVVVIATFAGLRLAGRHPPSPFILLYVIVVLASAAGGRAAGMATGLISVGYLVVRALSNFGSPDIGPALIHLTVAALMILGTAYILGQLGDQQRRYRQLLQARETAAREIRLRLAREAADNRDAITTGPTAMPGPEPFADLIIVRLGLDGRLVEVPPGLGTLLGYSELELSQKKFGELTHPDDVEVDVREFDRLRRAEVSSYAIQKRYLHKDGSIVWVYLAASLVRDDGGQPIEVLGYLIDITRKKQTEALLQGERRLFQLIATRTPSSEVLNALNETVEAIAAGSMSSILRLAADGKHIEQAISRSLPVAYNRALEGLAIGPVAGSCGTAMYRREPVIVEDIETDPLWQDYRDLVRPYGLRACWSTPIISADDTVLGSFAIYYTRPHTPSEYDLEIMARMADLARITLEATRSEAALRESEQAFRYLFERSPEPMWVYSRETMRFLEVNDAAVTKYGFGHEEFYRMTIADIQPAEDFSHAVQSAESVGDSFHFSGEWTHRLKDGSLIDVEVFARRIRFQGRDANLVVVHDITVRKHAEEELRQRAEELQGLAELSVHLGADLGISRELQLITDCARDLLGFDVAICDYSANGEGERYLALAEGAGADPEAIRRADLGNIAAEITGETKLLHPDPDELSNSQGRQSVLKAIPSIDASRDLMAVPLRVRGGLAGMLIAGGKASGRITATDEAVFVQLGHLASHAISQTRLYEEIAAQAGDLERTVAERTRELQELNVDLDAFAYSVSHDLRAPLRAMEGFARALLEDYGSGFDQQAREYCERILAAASSLSGMIEDLLTYSRVGRSDLDLGRVRLDRVVQSALDTMTEEIARSSAAVMRHLDPAEVRGHTAVLRQVIVNLVDNAIKFVPRGETPKIEVRVTDSGDFVELSIRDEGIGIPAPQQDRIFGVFERLHGAEEYQGTGIGLAIVKKAVERLDGTMEVFSKPNHGSTFRVRLQKFDSAGPVE